MFRAILVNDRLSYCSISIKNLREDYFEVCILQIVAFILSMAIVGNSFLIKTVKYLCLLMTLKDSRHRD